jgi:hypothetical protein
MVVSHYHLQDEAQQWIWQVKLLQDGAQDNFPNTFNVLFHHQCTL